MLAELKHPRRSTTHSRQAAESNIQATEMSWYPRFDHLMLNTLPLPPVCDVGQQGKGPLQGQALTFVHGENGESKLGSQVSHALLKFEMHIWKCSSTTS